MSQRQLYPKIRFLGRWNRQAQCKSNNRGHLSVCQDFPSSTYDQEAVQNIVPVATKTWLPLRGDCQWREVEKLQLYTTDTPGNTVTETRLPV